MKKIDLKKLLQFIFGFLSILICMMSRNEISSAYYFIVISFIITIIVLKKYTLIKNKRINISSVLLSIYYIISLSYRSVLNSELCLTSTIGAKVFIFYTTLPLLILLSSYINISYLIDNRNKITNNINKEMSFDIKTISLLIITLFSILSFVGNMSLNSYPDINGVLNWVNHGYWSHWHTIGYEIYMWIFTKPFGLLGVLFIQGLLFILINKYIIDIIDERFNNKHILVYLIMNMLFFQPYVFNHLAPKDTIFSLSVFGLAAAFFDILTSKKITKRNIIYLFIFSILTSIFRHAAIIAVVLTLIVAVIVYRKNKEFTRIFISCIVLCIASFSFITYFIGDYILHAVQNEYYIKYTTPAYMIGSYMKDDYKFDNINDLEKYLSKEEWKSYYDKYWADTLSRKWVLEGKEKRMEQYNLGPVFVKTNIRLLLDNPMKYIIKLSHIDSILFEISTPVDGYDWAPVRNHSIHYEVVNDFSHNNFFHHLTNIIENTTGEIEVIKDILWRGGFYQFIYLIYIVISILNKEKKKILFLLPIIIIQLLLYISLPSQDPRYVLPMIIIFPLATILTFIKTNIYRK